MSMPSADPSVNPPVSAPAKGSGEPPTKPSRVWWIHPLCFALFPLLSLYAANIDQVPYPDVYRPIAFALLFAVALGGLIFLAVREGTRTALLLTVFLFFIFSYGHVADLFEQLTQARNTTATGVRLPMSPQSHSILLGVWCVLLGAVLLIVRRIPRDLLRQLTAILNLVGVLLVALPAWTITSCALKYQIMRPAKHVLTEDPIQDRLAQDHFDPKLAPSASAPDIYYILLDAYGRADVLQHFYGYDNQPFLDALRQRGFYIARQAHPNYGQTVESISSSLNMTYLDKVAAEQGKRSVSYGPLTVMIDRNAVVAALRPRGYQYVGINTGFNLTVPTHADMLLGDEHVDTQRSLTPYDVLALDTTPFAHIPETEQTVFDEHRDQLIQGFHDLGELPRLPFRKFVFAHILAPHPPFVFGPNGEAVRPANRAYSIADGSDYMRRGTRPEYQTAYIAQLQHINTLVLKTIDTIYANSKVRPIIIVQGDHGPRMFVDWGSLERTDVRETYGNLNALELPDGSAPTVFYDDMTPVNTFRLLLDHYFNAGYPRLPDRSYYATLDTPYDFTDVTAKVPASLTSPVPSSSPSASPTPQASANAPFSPDPPHSL